jgi:hypothetical protein
LAVTAAFALNVSVQVVVLFPPLEHAPDQMTSRSFVARSVIAALLFEKSVARGASYPRTETHSSCSGGRCLAAAGQHKG